MKKFLLSFVTVFSLLFFSTSTAFAAPLADGGYLELREVRNDAAGGVIFVFDVVGEFSKADFKGSFLTFGDNRFSVDCNLGEGQLHCTTSRVTAGQYVTLNIGDFLFWVRVPERSGSPSSETSVEYCYPVLDLDEVNEWDQIDTHCQDTPANYGDTLIYFSEVDFTLMPYSPICSQNSHSGDAFYRNLYCEF
jgi:hypothetical protein